MCGDLGLAKVSGDEYESGSAVEIDCPLREQRAIASAVSLRGTARTISGAAISKILTNVPLHKRP